MINNIKLINNYNRLKANLGADIEELINFTNDYYRNKNIALIYKKPTPIQVVKVSYESRNKAKIIEAYYKTPSTTDYNGLYNGLYIDFEVKETHNLTTFPLSNIKKHQENHLYLVNKLKGIAFLIIYWSRYDESYLLFYNDYIKIVPNKKSLTYDDMKKYAHLIKKSSYKVLDYLEIINDFIRTNIKM